MRMMKRMAKLLSIGRSTKQNSHAIKPPCFSSMMAKKNLACLVKVEQENGEVINKVLQEAQQGITENRGVRVQVSHCSND